MQQLVNRVHEAAAGDMNMKINVKKTEVMKVSDDPSPTTVTVGSDTLQKPSRSSTWEPCSTLRRHVSKRSNHGAFSASATQALYPTFGYHRIYQLQHAETESAPNVVRLLSAETECPPVPICPHSATKPKPKPKFGRPLH